VRTHNSDTEYFETYLRRINGEYYFYVLGKAGEPIVNAEIEKLELTPLVSDKKVYIEEFATDRDGKVKLGTLKEIVRINISGFKNDKRFNFTWNLPYENESFQFPYSLHFLEGEEIILPYPHEMFNSGNISLMKVNSLTKPIKNLFGSIEYKRKEGHEYGDIILRDLEYGESSLNIF